ncbi:hypothetical protein Tco_1301964 [Tanacetum coccineum]
MSTPTPPPTTEATNPPSTLPDFASVFQFNNRVTTLEQEVAKLKKDPLYTQVTNLVDEHLDVKLGATRDEFMNFSRHHSLQGSQSKSRINCYRFCQRSRKDKDKDEGLKKKKTSKDAELATGPKGKESKSGSSKGTKSLSKSSGKSVQSEEPEFEVADSDMPQDQEENLGKEDEEPKEKVVSKRDWFTKPTQPQEPTDPD